MFPIIPFIIPAIQFGFHWIITILQFPGIANLI
jgi:hypothetical protein